MEEIEEIGLEQARPRLGDIVDKARLAWQATRITRQGKPAAVVVNARWYAEAVADLERFKPQPMSQNCRDGKHNGTGDDRCLQCECLCHRAERDRVRHQHDTNEGEK